MAVTNSPQLQSRPNISRIPPTNIALIREVWKIFRNKTRKQAFYPPGSPLHFESAQLGVLLSFRLPQLAGGEAIRSRNTSKMWPLSFTFFSSGDYFVHYYVLCPIHVHLTNNKQ